MYHNITSCWILCACICIGKEDPTAGVRKSKRQAKKDGDDSDDDSVEEVDNDGSKLCLFEKQVVWFYSSCDPNNIYYDVNQKI